jgi:16S rRNA (cytosine1402-N4)-methyltransferase
MAGYHEPVMLAECLDALQVQPDGVYVDATLGGGGHARAILAALGEKGRLFAFDTDEDARANVPDDDRCTFIHANYRHIKRYLKLYQVSRVNGILADFGVSSYQIDTAERGFSIRFDAPLDMRMNRQQSLTAYEIVNHYPYRQLVEILGEYGEVQNAKTLARAIEQQRAIQPIATTGELVAVCRKVVRGKEPQYLAQVFQAFRIAVNDEMTAIREFIEQSAELLETGGRLVVLTYHSLEDRPVKNYMRNGTFGSEPEKDIYGRFSAPLRPVTKKPLEATVAEISSNPRARSSKLRIAEKQ